MKKIVLAGLIALGVSALTAQACLVSGVVACDNGQSAAGILVSVTVDGTLLGTTPTSANGAYSIDFPTSPPGLYEVCVVPSSLPTGFTSVSGCQDFPITVDSSHFIDANFTLDGPACTPPTPGPCWLTGGGTVDKVKGQPHYSYGGVVNPGCSPTAAGGGNWNVVDHFAGLHFKGIDIQVIACSGVATKSPKVNVNIIDYKGTGTIVGVSGNSFPLTAVTFVARAVDVSEPGSGKDMLFVQVKDAVTGTVLLQIGDDVDDPATITTGNLQIHTTGCN
jgi:hypothetical protein